MIKRPPDFIIGGEENPYMLRWWLIPRNRNMNVYLHKILRNDADIALHDHPWDNLSIVLKGQYLERTLSPEGLVEWLSYATKYHDKAQEHDGLTAARNLYSAHDYQQTAYVRRAGTIVFRRARTPHRLELIDGKPCWSLFITGPNVRKWGFHLAAGWRHYREVVDPDEPGQWKKEYRRHDL